MLDFNSLIELARVTAKANAASPVAYSFGEDKFTYTQLNDTLRTELNEYAKTPALYRENMNKIFSLIEVTVDDVLPARVMEMYGMFAEIKQFGQGEKAVFTQRVTAASRRRAKQFITKVGLAGVYEVFKLDGRSFTLEATAYGGAAQISIEEFLDGRLDFAELLDIVMEALDEKIYVEIANALVASIENLQEANKSVQNNFNEVEMDRLISVASAYGKPTIYCTYEFAATMVPSEGWVADAHRVEKWNNGYLANYKGHNVIVLPQSYADETNKVKVIDPSYCYIIPSGGDAKVVKIAFEGNTLVDEWKNHDWSREVRVYKKVGVGTVITNNICVYRNTSLVR
jgi:hypothetical protein